MKKFLAFMIVLLLAIGFTGFAIKKGYLKKEEAKYVTFSYSDGIYEDYKCKIKDEKINCMVIEPSNPKAEFMGWYDSDDNKVDIDGDFSDEITLYPKYLTDKIATKEKQTEKKHIITFNMNGGIGNISKIEVEYEGQLYNLKTLPQRTGYTFLGFYDKKNYNKGKQYYNEKGESIRNFDKASNTTLYAGWLKDKVEEEKVDLEVTQEPIEEIKEYKITFNSNGGVGGQNGSVTATYGEELPEISSTMPIKNGFEFMGWYDNTDWTKGSQYYDSNGNASRIFIKNSDITLYAGWEKQQIEVPKPVPEINPVEEIKYTVAFNANGGTGGQSSSIKATPNQEMPTISTASPTRTGYEFTGWYDNVDYTKGSQYYTNKNVSAKKFDKMNAITLYAGWKANTFTVAYNSNGGTGNTSSHTCKYDNSCTLKENGFKKTGYIFIGWKKGNSGSIQKSNSSIKNVVSSGTITYYAQWEAKNYTISFNANGGAGGQSTNVIVSPGKEMPTISTTSPTRTGYTFTGWYDNVDYTKGSQYYTNKNASAKNFDKTSNITLYAGWKPKTFTVSFDLNGGSGTKPGNLTVMYNSIMPKISAAVPVKSNYTFKGWYDNSDYTKGHKYYNVDGSSARPYDKTITTILYAGWELNKVTTYTISFNANGGTGGQSSSVKASYNSTMPKISTTAPTKSNHIFMGWYDNKNFKTGIQYYSSTGTSTRKYDLKGDITLYAGWLATDTFIVKYNCNGGTGTIEDDTFKKGTVYIPKLNACTKDGYTFEKWSPYKTASNKTNWTFVNLDSYAENGKYSIKNNVITLYARWKEKQTTLGTQKLKLTSKTLVNDCSTVIGKRNYDYNGQYDIYCKYESPTLKYYIERPYKANTGGSKVYNNGVIISQIWVKNFEKQIKVAISPVDSNWKDGRRKTWKPDEIINNEINTKKYDTKGLFGVNASPMVSERFYTKAPSSWKNSPALEYWKNNGKILRNAIADDYSKSLGDKYIYGISKNGEFKYYKMSRNDNKNIRVSINNRIAEYIESDGIKDTFTWRPILINNGVKATNANSGGQYHGFCQIDKNNYVVITTMVPPNRNGKYMRENNPTSYEFIQEKMLEYGCQTGVLFDGGGSIATFAKGKTADSLKGPGYAHDHRTGADVLYFVEQ